MGPELIVIVLILFVFVLPLLVVFKIVQWATSAADEQRVDELERRVDELERELQQR